MPIEIFRALHQGPALLVLHNAWDAATARLIESMGAKAIATTSAGLAWSRGYPDGNALPEDQLIAVTCDIARVIRVPLTVDIEAGYSDDPQAVAGLVTRVLTAGAAGIKPMPLNIMAVPDLPPMQMLLKHGVRRLSAGSAIAQAALGRTRHLAADFLAGTMSEMFEAAVQYGAMNQLLADNADP